MAFQIDTTAATPTVTGDFVLYSLSRGATHDVSVVRAEGQTRLVRVFSGCRYFAVSLEAAEVLGAYPSLEDLIQAGAEEIM